MATEVSGVDGVSSLIDISSRSSGFGGYGNSTFSVLHGINVRGGLTAIPHNTDNQGYAFFFKPMLNLSYNNVINSRTMAYLADPRPNSMGLAIKCLLNPVGFNKAEDGIRSAIVRDTDPFITPLTNLLLTMSEPPDIAVDSYTSKPGRLNEVTAMVDGVYTNYNHYDLTMTFKNMEGDPVSYIFGAWVEYPVNVNRNIMSMMPINIKENCVDYYSRIFRIILDRTKTYVQDIFSTMGYPTTVPLGSKFGYDHSNHFNSASNDIRITFKCVGAEFRDAILMHEFNALVAMHNPAMRGSKSGMKQVTRSDGLLFTILDGRLTPFLNDRTNELEWYCTSSDYNEARSLTRL